MVILRSSRAARAGLGAGILRLTAYAALAILLAFPTRGESQDSALWRYTSSEPISFYRLTPLGDLVLGTTGGLVALDLGTGEPVWTRDDITDLGGEDLTIIPLFPLGLVQSHDGVGWIDLATGLPTWNSNAQPLLTVRWYFMVPPLRLLLLFGASAQSPSTLVAVDIQTGEVRWRQDNLLGVASFEDGHQPPVADTDSTVILYVDERGPIKLHARTGRLIWRAESLNGREPPMPVAGYPSMLHADGFLFVPYENRLMTLSTHDGTVAWDRETAYGIQVDQMELTEAGLLVRGRNPLDADEDVWLDLLDPETGEAVWQLPVTDFDNHAPFVVQGGTIYVTQDRAFVGIDLEDGSAQQLATFKFEGGERPERIVARGDDFLLYSSQNLLLLADDYTERYRRYHRAPGVSFLQALGSSAANAVLEGVGRYVAGVVVMNMVGAQYAVDRLIHTGRVSAIFFDFGDVNRVFEERCQRRGIRPGTITIRRENRDDRIVMIGSFCADELAGLFFGPNFVAALKERYTATVNAVDYAYVYTSEPQGDREGYSLVRVDKTNGEGVGRVWIDEKEPDFLLDPTRGIVLVKKNETTVVAFQFPSVVPVTLLDDAPQDRLVTSDSLRSISRPQERVEVRDSIVRAGRGASDDVERATLRVAAVSSRFEGGAELHGGGVWVAQSPDAEYIAVPGYLVGGASNGATAVHVALEFADSEMLPATVLDSIDAVSGLSVLQVEHARFPEIPANDGDPSRLAIGAIVYVVDETGGSLVEAGSVSSRDGLFLTISRSVFPQPVRPFVVQGGALPIDGATGIATAADPQNPETVYAGHEQLHQTTDAGWSWVAISPDLPSGRGAISTIAPSPVDPRVIWVGTDDGLVHLTRRGGRVWTRVTPRDREVGQVVHIEASPTDAGAAVVFFRDANQPDAILRVIQTSNYGREWEQAAPSNLRSSQEGSAVVGGGLFDSDRQLIGLVISRDERKITALRLDVVLEWLRSRSAP